MRWVNDRSGFTFCTRTVVGLHERDVLVEFHPEDDQKPKLPKFRSAFMPESSVKGYGETRRQALLSLADQLEACALHIREEAKRS